MAPAWIGLLSHTLQQPEAMEQFRQETGHDIFSVLNARGLEAAVDKATGYDLTVIGAFGDWVTVNLWGVEGQEGDE